MAQAPERVTVPSSCGCWAASGAARRTASTATRTGETRLTRVTSGFLSRLEQVRDRGRLQPVGDVVADVAHQVDQPLLFLERRRAVEVRAHRLDRGEGAVEQADHLGHRDLPRV